MTWTGARGLAGAAGIVAALAIGAACDRGHVEAPVDRSAAEEGPASVSATAVTSSGQGAQAATSAGAPPRPADPTAKDAGSCPAEPKGAWAKQAAADVGIMISPARPVEGQPLRIVAATLDDERPLAVRVDHDDAEAEAEIVAQTTFRTGVPAATIARIDHAPAGTLRVVVGRDGTGLRCTEVRVAAGAGRRTPRAALPDAVWPVERAWTGAEEALYSAWVRELFHAPRGDELARKALHEVTSDPQRNVLHDHFVWREDDENRKVGLHLRPDCADTPYFLRAYFAWKRGLPFAFRACSRGSAGKAPGCGKLKGVLGSPEGGSDAAKPGELGVVQKFFRRTLAWGVHTGNGRTAHGDDDTDFYTVALSRRSLRPGTIYADPYGHIFVMVELMAPEGEQPGVLYAIDGQPDGSITRKRFWEGNFLWNPDPALGGSGFKAFRPIDVVSGPEGARLRAATDAEIATRPGYGDASREQAELDAPGFYDTMDALVTPGKRDPLVAQAEAVRALNEAAQVRVTSVDNGEAHFAGGGGEIAMPDGHAIFETTGAWESFATPARDLRLLIAIDVVMGFEGKVARKAATFLRAGQTIEDVTARLRTARAELLENPSLAFEYTRSDGSKWKLTLAELVARAPALEIAYDPNDCPEIRWGAPEGSDERRTCKRRAPAAHQKKLEVYRPWFHERRRPARGDAGP